MKDNTIKLVSPSKDLEVDALDYRQEHFDCGEMLIYGSALFDKTESYDEWLSHVRKNSNAETVQPDWVVTSTFFGVRESDSKIVGMIDVRHSLNDFLREYGGNIGFSVRPSERQKGYATQMLHLALDYCKTIGLQRVMIVCYKSNVPSIKTITKCGGVFERELLYVDGKQIVVFGVEYCITAIENDC
jgi:predicted acetyltransferase